MVQETKEKKLAIQDLSLSFGGVQALRQVSFDIAAQSITGLIGPNGAGKTSLFNCLTGFYRPNHGAIFLYQSNGRQVDINGLIGMRPRGKGNLAALALGKTMWYRFFGGTYLVARAGIARTFQNIRLFPEMTVLENLLVAQHRFMKTRIMGGLLATKTFRQEEQGFIRDAYEWLDFVDLKTDAHRLAKTLPYGHQRKLEIARAMATRPELLCLDEPAAGLNPKETQELGALIRGLRDKFGVAVVMIEHDMGLVMELCDEIVVLNFGEVIASGKPAAIRKNPKVLAAYLGDEDNDAT